jgi:hypothetical protein
MSEVPSWEGTAACCTTSDELLACDGGGEPEVPDLVCIECG